MNGRNVTIPIVMTSRAGGRETWIALHSPIAPGVPAENDLRVFVVLFHSMFGLRGVEHAAAGLLTLPERTRSGDVFDRDYVIAVVA